MPEPIRIDVWSDVACPWCYIGKRKLELGIEAFAAEPDAPPVAVEYHSFELSPDMPEDFTGTIADFLVRHKGFPAEQIGPMHERVAGIAAEVGLDCDFAAQQPANTRKAHQLLHLAKAHDLQTETKDRLLEAHFVEGRHVGRTEELAELAAEVGLDRDEALSALREETYQPAVDEDIHQARELGISGVPFFMLDGRYGISGAQSPETFTRALTTVQAERHQSSPA